MRCVDAYVSPDDLREARLLRAPFFTARTPHAWDGADGAPARAAPRPTPRAACGS